MYRIVLFALVLLLPVSVSAQEIVLNTNCATLANLDGDGDAEYEAGVDVNGNPVAAADIDEPLQALEYPLAVPIEIDFLRSFNVGTQDGLEINPEIGYLLLQEDGRVEYNGQDISKHVTVKCAEEGSLIEQAFEDIVESNPEPAAGTEHNVNEQVQELEEQVEETEPAAEEPPVFDEEAIEGVTE